MAELGGASALPGPAVVVAVDFAEFVDAVAGFHEVVGRVDADDGGGIDDAVGEVGVAEDGAGEAALGRKLAKVRRGNAVDDSPVLNLCLRFVHVCAPFLCPVGNLFAQRLSLVKDAIRVPRVVDANKRVRWLGGRDEVQFLPVGAVCAPASEVGSQKPGTSGRALRVSPLLREPGRKWAPKAGRE